MINLIDFELALLKGDNDEIAELLQQGDVRTANARLRQAGEKFGFKTVEVHGIRYAKRGDLALVMGYADESGLRKLCERMDLEGRFIGGFGQNVRDLLAEELGLVKNDRRTVLVAWSVFLLAGMSGTTEPARRVKRYLLEMEKAARVSAGMVDIARARNDRLDEVGKVVNIAFRATRIEDARIRASVIQYLNQMLPMALSVPLQHALFPPNDPPQLTAVAMEGPSQT